MMVSRCLLRPCRGSLRPLSMLAALLILSLGAGPLVAGVPKPDFVIHGQIHNGCLQPFTAEMGVRAEARREDGSVVAAMLLGADSDDPNGYVLRVETDSGAPPYRPGSVLLDEVLDIVVVREDSVLHHAQAYVGAHGFLLRQDFGDEDGAVFEAADAGPDLLACGASVQLQAVIPQQGSGQWLVLSGDGGVFADPSDPHSTFTGIIGRDYHLRWELSNPPCGASVDQTWVSLLPAGEPAEAGADRTLCGVTTTFLNARTPSVGSGTWTLLSGVGGFVENRHDPQSAFRGVIGEQYQLRWRLSEESCGAREDQVMVTFQAGDALVPTILGATSACSSEPVYLEASPGFAGYQWSTGATTRGIWVDAAETANYTVLATSADGCAAAARHLVTRTPGVLAVAIENETVALCDPNGVFQLRARAGCGAGGPYSYHWELTAGPPAGGSFANPDTATPRFTPLGHGVYRFQVTVTDRDGAEQSADSHVFRFNNDLNGDGSVDDHDQAMRIAAWGAREVAVEHDLDGSGTVSVLDLLISRACY